MTDMLYIGLIVGPDAGRTVQLPLKSVAELFDFLQLSWKGMYVDNIPETDLGARIEQTVNAWNVLWGDHQAIASPDLWRWQGIALGGHIHRDATTIDWNLDLHRSNNPRMVMDIKQK